MWLRIGKRGRWLNGDPEDPDTVSKAALDLVPRDDEQLSIYKAANKRQAYRIASAYALTQRSRPDNIDIVIFPSRLFRSGSIIPVFVLCPELPEYLRCKHYEAPCLDKELKRVGLARRALRTTSGLIVDRLYKTDVKEYAINRRVISESGVREAISPRWWIYLNDS